LVSSSPATPPAGPAMNRSSCSAPSGSPEPKPSCLTRSSV